MGNSPYFTGNLKVFLLNSVSFRFGSEGYFEISSSNGYSSIEREHNIGPSIVKGREVAKLEKRKDENLFDIGGN